MRLLSPLVKCDSVSAVHHAFLKRNTWCIHFLWLKLCHCLSFAIPLHRVVWLRERKEPKTNFRVFVFMRFMGKNSARPNSEISLLWLLGCRGGICVVGTKYKDWLLLYLLETEGHWYILIELTPYITWTAETADFLLKLQQLWVFNLTFLQSQHICILFLRRFH